MQKAFPQQKRRSSAPRGTRPSSYGRLRDEMNRVGLGLLSLGVKKGDRVCIYLDSSPEYLVSYFAIWRIGAVAVPTNIVYRGKELLHVINDAGACTVITDLQGAGIIGTIRKEAPTISHIICTSGSCDGSVAWDSFPPAPENTRAANCSAEDLCHIQYTAGTTGRPKGAMLTHGNWMTALDTERDALRLRPVDVYLGIYPMGHVGLSWGLAVIRSGGTYVMMERFEPERYLALARQYRVTVLAGMPPVIHSLVHSPPGTEEQLATARVIISGGGQLLPVVWEAFDYALPYPGRELVRALGDDRDRFRYHHAPEYPHLTKEYQSVGVAVGYTEIRIVDSGDPERELPFGECGEVALRGPAVAKGYWNLPEATREVFRPDGWFLTGDIGYLDPDGILCITDRKKDMIIMSGWKIYPTEVENVIIRHPAVADVAVFGVPDERRGEVPVAAIVFRPGMALGEEELGAYCRDHMAGYKIPTEDSWSPDSLPRVHGWKLLRRELREKFSNPQE